MAETKKYEPMVVDPFSAADSEAIIVDDDDVAPHAEDIWANKQAPANNPLRYTKTPESMEEERRAEASRLALPINALQGLSSNFLDELLAGTQEGDYGDNLAAMQAAYNQINAENPRKALAGNLLGSVAQGALIPGLGATNAGAGTLGRAGTEAAKYGALGALAGVGAGETAEERALGGAVGGGIGGAVGGGASLLRSGLAGATKPVPKPGSVTDYVRKAVPSLGEYYDEVADFVTAPPRKAPKQARVPVSGEYTEGPLGTPDKRFGAQTLAMLDEPLTMERATPVTSELPTAPLEGTLFDEAATGVVKQDPFVLRFPTEGKIAPESSYGSEEVTRQIARMPLGGSTTAPGRPGARGIAPVAEEAPTEAIRRFKGPSSAPTSTTMLAPPPSEVSRVPYGQDFTRLEDMMTNPVGEKISKAIPELVGRGITSGLGYAVGSETGVKGGGGIGALTGFAAGHKVLSGSPMIRQAVLKGMTNLSRSPGALGRGATAATGDQLGHAVTWALKRIDAAYSQGAVEGAMEHEEQMKANPAYREAYLNGVGSGDE